MGSLRLDSDPSIRFHLDDIPDSFVDPRKWDVSDEKIVSCFHLNLNFSVLSESEKEVVIDKCYEPFIELRETYPYSLGFEASASSLLQIKRYRPKLFNKLCDLINTGYVGFSQSGSYQIIWPLS